MCQFDTYGPHDRAPRYELGCLPVLLIAFLLVWAFSDRSASESAEYVLSAVIAIPLYIVLKLFGVE